MRFRSNPELREGEVAMTSCENSKTRNYLLVAGTSCPLSGGDSKWEVHDTLFVANGSDFCAGHKRTGKKPSIVKEGSYSRILNRPNCSGDGFVHDVQFGSVAPPEYGLMLDSGAPPSPQELAESTLDKKAPPLYKLVTEDDRCDGFFCPHVLDLSIFNESFAAD